MFTEYFRFNQNPFNLADNTAVFFVDDNREKICQQILSNLEDGVSPILLTGVQGVGKSKLLRHLATLWPTDIQKIKPFNSCLSYADRVFMSFDLMADTLQDSAKLLLVVDNADDIADNDLKTLFSIPERYAKKVQSFQMIWCGSGDLEARLSKIDASKFENPYPYLYRLDVLDQVKIKDYIELHIKQCGYRNEIRGDLFSPAAIAKITQLSQGRPYAINLLCSASLLVTYLDRQHKVSEQNVDEASLLCFSNYSQNNASPGIEQLLGKNEIFAGRVTFQDLHKISKRSRHYHRQMKQWTQYLSNQHLLSGHSPATKTSNRLSQLQSLKDFSLTSLITWRPKIKFNLIPTLAFTKITPSLHKVKQGLIEKRSNIQQQLVETLSFAKASIRLPKLKFGLPNPFSFSSSKSISRLPKIKRNASEELSFFKSTQQFSRSKFSVFSLMILGLCAIGFVSLRHTDKPLETHSNHPANVAILNETLPVPVINAATPIKPQNETIETKQVLTDTAVTALNKTYPVPAISTATPIKHQNETIETKQILTDTTVVPTVAKNGATKAEYLTSAIPNIPALPKAEHSKQTLTLTNIVNTPKASNRHPEPKPNVELILTHIAPPKIIPKTPKQTDAKIASNVPKLLKEQPAPTLAKHPQPDTKDKITPAPPKQIVAVLDEQEKATRDRAASRLNLDKQGVEFNVDALMVAAQKGDLRTLKLLIAGGIPPDIKSHQGQTALMTATRHGQQQIVKELLSLKAQPNVQDKLGWTALKYATQHQQPEISNILVSAGARP